MTKPTRANFNTDRVDNGFGNPAWSTEDNVRSSSSSMHGISIQSRSKPRTTAQLLRDTVTIIGRSQRERHLDQEGRKSLENAPEAGRSIHHSTHLLRWKRAATGSEKGGQARSSASDPRPCPSFLPCTTQDAKSQHSATIRPLLWVRRRLPHLSTRPRSSSLFTLKANVVMQKDGTFLGLLGGSHYLYRTFGRRASSAL